MQKDSVERSLKSCAKGLVGQAQNSENVKTSFLINKFPHQKITENIKTEMT